MGRLAIVSFAESRGGAAKSARNFFLACRERGVNARFVVVEKTSADAGVVGPGALASYWHFVKRATARLLQSLQRDDVAVKRSLNIFSCSFVVAELAEYQCVHLHWINNETISLKDLSAIRGKVVMSMHDEWLYCGSEHLALGSRRPFEGYTAANKVAKGLDWDRIIWARKKRALDAIRGRLIITAPSTWLVARARESLLLRDHEIRLVPNSIDVELFSPQVPSANLNEYHVSVDTKIILFGAVRGGNMHLKGTAVLREALALLFERVTDKDGIALVTFGGRVNDPSLALGFRHIEMGQISDARELAQLYRRATVTVVPSFVESFGQVAAESLSCETPVVAFDCSGLKDIVMHRISGCLATPFSAESLCEEVLWVLTREPEERLRLGRNGRRHVVERFAKSVVMDRLFAVYRELGMPIVAPTSVQ